MAESFPGSPVRSEILIALASALNPEGALCSEPEGADDGGKAELWELCLALGDALVAQGSFEEGFLIVSELIGWNELTKYPGKHRVLKNAALQNFTRGRLSGAEDFLKLALKDLFQKETLSASEIRFLILRSVTLADVLLAQGRPRLEAEMELTGTVTSLDKKLGAKSLDSYPESPLLFWYLGRIIRDEGRQRDAGRLFDRALRAADAARKAHPERESDLIRLKELVTSDRKAKKGAYPRFPLSPDIFFGAEQNYAGKYPKVPSPSAMRLELNALKELGRASEFKDRIDWALSLSKEENPNSPDNLRYRSLKLKFLEETQNYEELLLELNDMRENVKFNDPEISSRFQSSTRSYEARTRLAQGDPKGALEAYEAALELLKDANASGEREALEKEILNVKLMAQ
jgi:hypothetical protein